MILIFLRLTYFIIILSPVTSILLQIIQLHSSLWLYRISLCIYHIFFVHSSVFGHLCSFYNSALWIKLQYTLMCEYLGDTLTWSPLSKYQVVVDVFLCFGETSILISMAAGLVYNHQQCMRVSFHPGPCWYVFDFLMTAKVRWNLTGISWMASEWTKTFNQSEAYLEDKCVT